MAKAESGVHELIAREAAAAERYRDAPDQPGTRVSRGIPRGRTLQVRLSAEEFAAIDRAARDAGLPPSTYARQILLAAQSTTSNAEVIARIRADLDLLMS